MPKKPRAFRREPHWYKEAIIYELHVRAFFDSNEDGIGDFAGLEQKLDYLQDLGVTAIWLLPFYISPLRDDGYDIANYTQVHPTYGTVKDFENFLKAAHRRGLHVITELVINHTSDQHPWFQTARRAPAGSRKRDFYVWSHTTDRYKDARIIFKDFEASNWSWDPVANAYYWHRFYFHQPDLNFENPDVKRAITKILDFWLAMGVDGLRLDAVPYLYEQEDTNCENLPQTHAYLKELRAHIDLRFQNCMLLAEANQWPEDAIAYFGNGDECHMAFHFPLMPRLFMAIRMEDRYPIIDILEQTPAIPENCQWAVFLRNHDELTLEMVTDEDRDYMYRTYARDRQARINLGIRRRLAPLLENNRRRVELMNGLLFSLPGTPVLYYGDEIGMGDNIYLGDRNGVRTPMQWSSDRNAGFSKANPQKLYLPIITDPEYHYEALNVEAQQHNSNSLLWWMKRIIALRKRYRALNYGTLQFLHPTNRKVLAFLRSFGNETILVIANLSRLAQCVELDLSAYRNYRPIELFGRTAFPNIGELPYFITLSPHSFYWFSLEPSPTEISIGRTMPHAIITVDAIEKVSLSMFEDEITAALPAYLAERRWFSGKGRLLDTVMIGDVIPLLDNRLNLYLIEVSYTEGEHETYLLPLYLTNRKDDVRSILETQAQSVLAKLETPTGNSAIIYDATYTPVFSDLLLSIFERKRRVRGENGDLWSTASREFTQLLSTSLPRPSGTLSKLDQSNTAITYGERFFLKLFRRLDEGQNPEVEMGRFLSEKANFSHSPVILGTLDYIKPTHDTGTVGILQRYFPNEGDAWQYTLDELQHYFEKVLTRIQNQPAEEPTLSYASAPLLSLAKEPPPSLASDLIGPYLQSVELLGQRTAELHIALASDHEDPNFAPEPYSTLYQRSLYQSLRTHAAQVFEQLRSRASTLPQDLQPLIKTVLDREPAIHGLFRMLITEGRKIRAMRIRCHGDYHLGQILFTGKDFIILDFEGEPLRTLSNRKIKRSPLQDVAGMIQSFHYAAYAALFGQPSLGIIQKDHLPSLEPWAYLWSRWTAATFLKTYLRLMADTGLLPPREEDVTLLLSIHLFNKSIYELGYELNQRPDWVRISLVGINHLLDSIALMVTPQRN